MQSSTTMVAHTATARNGEFDVIVPSKSTARLVLLKAGLIEYYSRFHPIMAGRLKIEPQPFNEAIAATHHHCQP
jgi:hypothetical protein